MQLQAITDDHNPAHPGAGGSYSAMRTSRHSWLQRLLADLGCYLEKGQKLAAIKIRLANRDLTPAGA